jgi:hypothetical protein
LFPLIVPSVLVLFVSVTGYGILRLRMPADVALVLRAAIGLEDFLAQARRSS